MLTHPMLAAAYAELGRQQDADREPAISARLWALLDARTFADQYGTEKARNHVLEGLKNISLNAALVFANCKTASSDSRAACHQTYATETAVRK